MAFAAYRANTAGYINTFFLSDFLANSISLFPGLETVILKTDTPVVTYGSMPISQSPFPSDCPDWLRATLYTFKSGRNLAWKATEPWSIYFPDYEEFLTARKRYRRSVLTQVREEGGERKIELIIDEQQPKPVPTQLPITLLGAERLAVRVIADGQGFQWDGTPEWRAKALRPKRTVVGYLIEHWGWPR